VAARVGEAPAGHPVVVAAAGEAALTAAPEWRERGWPREALATTPAVWHAERVGVEAGLVAAPFLAPGERLAVRAGGGPHAGLGATDPALNPPAQTLC
jgi:hypothetical protein